MDLNNITNIEVDGVDTSDYPDFCDAYISSAQWVDSGTELSDHELDTLNDEYGEFVYENVINSLI